MNQDCVVAIYDSFEVAGAGIKALEKGGYPDEQVSFVTSVMDDALPRNAAMASGDEAENQSATGAVAGGLLGALMGAPLLAVPGLGPVLAIGPIATGLTGAIVGGFLGAMSGWGVHEDHLQSYQDQVREGKVVIVANGRPDQVAHARELLRDTDPTELHMHAQTSADSPEIMDVPKPRL
jgi:hypothetical protein